MRVDETVPYTPYPWEPSPVRVFGGAVFALLGLTAIATLLIGGLMWAVTRGFFLVLS
jgi:hypothetical protein